VNKDGRGRREGGSREEGREGRSGTGSVNRKEGEGGGEEERGRGEEEEILRKETITHDPQAVNTYNTCTSIG